VARVYRNHKNYSDAELVSVIEPSPQRVEPRCPVFGQCGGCQYQNMRYEEQLAWKRRQVAELLKHMARMEHEVEPVIPSPVQYGYRSKITPHFAPPKEGRIGEIGFLADRSRYRIVDVPHCDIAMPELNARLTEVREDVRAHASRYKRAATLLLRASQGSTSTRSTRSRARPRTPRSRATSPAKVCSRRS
jgi:23S rRNA (uracil1939-C5)-methyltransferase/tRNA (uracil-5-)-methyltransferase